MPTKSQKLDTTKEKLRRAAHDLLSACSSPAEVTSRAIAEKAGVPVAMINYSFGSREALLFAVFQDLYTQIVASDATLSAILRSDATHLRRPILCRRGRRQIRILRGGL